MAVSITFHSNKIIKEHSKENKSEATFHGFLKIVKPYLSRESFSPLIIIPSKQEINKPCEEEQFIVYFELNSDRLSTLGIQEIKRVAHLIVSEGAKQVLVVGHADQVGSPIYNLRLSRRRCETVLQRLRQEKISPSILNADWKGEFDPSVLVGENDIEPLNRRVVIHVFQ